MRSGLIFETSVPYRSGRAWYKIGRETVGVYNACLTRFDGKAENRPPDEITLIRGFKSWAGSDNDEVLINTLGLMIEEYYS